MPEMRLSFPDKEELGLGYSEEEELLALMKQKEETQIKMKTSISAMPTSKLSLPGVTHPLSFNEEQMLQVFLTDPYTLGYNIASMVVPQHPMDPETLAHAWDILISRHSLLRSRYTVKDGNMCRTLTPHNPNPVDVVAVQNYHDIGRYNAMLFSWTHALGVCSGRFAALAGHNVPSVLSYNVHHIVADAESAILFHRDMISICESLHLGFTGDEVHARLPPLPIQFVDFAYWQQSIVANGLIAKELSYWHRSITSTCRPSVLDLPLDTPRSRVYFVSGATQRCRIDHDLLTQLIQQSMATPFSVVFTYFVIVLSKMTGSFTNIVGVPYGLRGMTELEPLIGDFINMLPAHVRHEPSSALISTLDHVTEVNMDVHRYAAGPFVKVREQTRAYASPQYDPSRNPVYQTLIDMVPTESDEPPASMNGIMDMFLFVNTYGEMRRVWSIDAVWNSTILNEQTARQMLMQLKALSLYGARYASDANYAQHPVPVVLDAPEPAQAPKSHSVAVLTAGLPLHCQYDASRPSLKNLRSVVQLHAGVPLNDVPEDYRFMHSSSRFMRNGTINTVVNVAKASDSSSGSPAEQKRLSDDGNAYTRQEFIEFFGGTAEWEAARSVLAIASNSAGLLEHSKAKVSLGSWVPRPAARERFPQVQGIIKFYSEESEFGFIDTDDAKLGEVQFHRSVLPFNVAKALKNDSKDSVQLKGRRVAFCLHVVPGGNRLLGGRTGASRNVLASSLRFLDGQGN